MKITAASVVLLAALLCPGAEAKGGSAIRGTPSAARNSNAWKYAAGGFVAGAATYYVGSRIYRHHVRYNDNDYNDYYNRQSDDWKRRNPRRSSTGCTIGNTGPRVDMTNAWVILQIVVDRPAYNFTAPEIEVDLFNELSFRSPCKAPTDVVALYTCSYDKPINRYLLISDIDRKMPERCQFNGDVSSLPEQHSDARRQLLQANLVDTYSVIEVAVGAVDVFEAKDIEQAAREMANDENSEAKKYYAMQPLSAAATEVTDVEAAAGIQPTLVALAAVLCAFLL